METLVNLPPMVPTLLSTLCVSFAFQWEGVFVPVVPVTLMDVLDSPVPALVGVQAPLEPLSYASDGVAVLDLDANNALVRVTLPTAVPTDTFQGCRFHGIFSRFLSRLGGRSGYWR